VQAYQLMMNLSWRLMHPALRLKSLEAIFTWNVRQLPR